MSEPKTITRAELLLFSKSETDAARALNTIDGIARIVKILSDRLKTTPCPMCDSEAGRTPLSPLAHVPIGIDAHGAQFFGISFGADVAMPVILLQCQNCGFISQHALRPLGVLPPIPDAIMNEARPVSRPTSWS